MVSVGKFDWPAQYGGQRGGISSALGAMTTANSEPIGKDKSVIMIDLLSSPLFRLGSMRSQMIINMHRSSGWF